MVAIESSVRKYCFKDNVRLFKLMLRLLVVIASSLPFSKHTSIGLHYFTVSTYYSLLSTIQHT